MTMYKVAIFVPVYYNEEAVATCLMKLTQCNFYEIEPTLILPITGIRESFIYSFLNKYVSTYNKISDDQIDAMFDRIITIYDNAIFDPTIMMNNFIDEHDEFDYIAVVEPEPLFEDIDWLPKLINLFNEYDYNRKLGAICTNNKSHSVSSVDRIQWFINNHSIIRTINGEGFGNGIMLTEKDIWSLVNGFNGINYTNTYSKSCFRHGHIVVYSEEIR